MNRDEQLSRMTAKPPDYFRQRGLAALYPHEIGGGTWIGINEAGMTFALINWYSQPQRPASETSSRGTVIPELLGTENSGEAEKALQGLSVHQMNPFRLILVSPAEQCLQEWRSDGTSLERTVLSWKKHHWFSSGFDEAEANRVRRLTCQRAAAESGADSLSWLRRLHRSHHPGKGAFSMCMHRMDARTVSYTEISVSGSAAIMVYHDGPPCMQGMHLTKSLRLRLNEECSNCVKGFAVR